ncbi:MAG TPA: 50S ribosomal protein L23 [Candidatus Saccharibacteria bacterium]|nr:50S ribosomal protein L23 [Candidatus Saccharibacteria bacterium]HMT39579.1 50S ribosomal protein L23 [Candidatus Saccharibacteria bacterium]
MNSVLLRPIITEKSMNQASAGTYMFEVPKNANKIIIKDAVSKRFKVDVIDVRISVLKGKIKKFRGHTGKRIDRKRAYVTIKSGQKIDAFEESK